jgi:adenine-specific DNA-methyltransferase
MPTLDWIGKKAVVNHHREVPYRLIHCDKDRSIGDPDAGNLLVQGDNLEALKALLPYYAGKVKCIYIDPPYNTGNEAWVYNDNVTSPEIKAWLGSVVGKEAEDLSRHDKWLCMMYPRLRLLKEFLSEDGSIWISIDDNEVHGLKLILDEIYGRQNFIANVIWQKKYTVANDARLFSDNHDHILCYAKDELNFFMNKIPRSEEMNARYSNPDNHIKGPWKATPLHAKSGSEKGRQFKFKFKNGYEWSPPSGTFPRFSTETLCVLDAGNEIWFGKDGSAQPSRKTFLSELKNDGTPPLTVWLHTDAASNHDAKTEAKSFNGLDVFATPKPEKLIHRIIHLTTEPGDLVLDSFAGSGTTGAVAHKMGRKHIGVEMGAHAATHIVPRYRKVIEGEGGGISAEVGWQGGGGFRFCTLGEPLFDADGNVSPAVTYPDLAAHVFFCETGSPIPRRASGETSLIGTFQGRAIYLLHNAEAVGVASTNAGNVLTSGVLDTLPLPEPDFTGARIVYGEGCTVPDDRLSRLGVTFKQIPYQIEGL